MTMKGVRFRLKRQFSKKLFDKKRRFLSVFKTPRWAESQENGDKIEEPDRRSLAPRVENCVIISLNGSFYQIIIYRETNQEEYEAWQN